MALHLLLLWLLRKVTMDNKNRDIETYVNNWCLKHGHVNYASDDFKVNNRWVSCYMFLFLILLMSSFIIFHTRNNLYCKLCHNTSKFTLAENGYWHATAFLQHITSKHSFPASSGIPNLKHYLDKILFISFKCSACSGTAKQGVDTSSEKSKTRKRSSENAAESSGFYLFLFLETFHFKLLFVMLGTDGGLPKRRVGTTPRSLNSSENEGDANISFSTSFHYNNYLLSFYF